VGAENRGRRGVSQASASKNGVCAQLQKGSMPKKSSTKMKPDKATIVEDGKLTMLGHYSLNGGSLSMTWDNGHNLQGKDFTSQQFELLRMAFANNFRVQYWFDGGTGAFGIDVFR
jgi:hypothetical protein